jgi:TolB-like protein
MGGNATITTKTGYKEIDGDVFSADIPNTVSTSFGADIILSDIGLSIGALLQQITAQKKENNQSVTLINIGYHWVDRKGPEPVRPASSGAMKGGSLVASSAPAPAAAAPTVPLAVAELEATDVSAAEAESVADWMRGELQNTGTFAVMVRGKSKKALEGAEFGGQPCTSDECAVKLGKQLEVKRVVVGSFAKKEGMYVLSVRLVDVDSGKVLYADTGKGATVDEGKASVKVMAGKMADLGGAPGR